MSNSFIYAVTLTICAILVTIQFFRWMSTEQRKRRSLTWLVGLGLLCLLPRALQLAGDELPDDLQQTHGTMKSAQYRHRNIGRTTIERVEIQLEGHETVFVYSGPHEKIERALRIQAVPITITHRAGSSAVWGIDLGGAVIDSPQQRIARERQFANLFALAGLGVLLIAVLIGRYVRVSSDNPDNTTVDDDASLTRQRTATGAAPPAVTSTTDRGKELPGSPKTGAKFRATHSATSAVSPSSAEKWTPDWLVVQIFVLPASILFGIVVTRWVWATQLPKGDLGHGGFLFVLLGMFLFLILVAVTHSALTLAAMRLHYLPRLCLLVGALSATYYGFQIQNRVESDKPPVRAERATATITTHEAAVRQEMALGLDSTRRPEPSAPPSSPHQPETVDKVLDHAPPGTVPPMLETNREAGALKVVNHATDFVDLRMASVHNPSGIWERCHWLAPITASRFSPTDVSVRLNAGESRLFLLDETCRDGFSDDPLEFVVRDGKGTALFKSDSAFYP